MIFHEACAQKAWTPFRVQGGNTHISHLLFADGILLFGEANYQTLNSMKILLKKFYFIKCQKVNESKSMLYFSLNTSVEVRDEFEQEMSILTTNDLGTYLGFPLCNRIPQNPSSHSLLIR